MRKLALVVVPPSILHIYWHLQQRHGHYILVPLEYPLGLVPLVISKVCRTRICGEVPKKTGPLKLRLGRTTKADDWWKHRMARSSLGPLLHTEPPLEVLVDPFSYAQHQHKNPLFRSKDSASMDVVLHQID
jgi:hypothetical protein